VSGTATRIRLPLPDGSLALHELGPPAAFQRPRQPLRSRVAFAAAHVVADPLAENVPGGPAHLDWEATLEYRRHLWSWGLGVAEAMDTAQRGMGLDWRTAAELIRRTLREAEGRVACGAGTDQLAPGSARSLDDVAGAYEEQCDLIEAAGGQVVLMASRELARLGAGPDDYARVYARVLGGLRRPAILHWLGPAFDPQLGGYWGHRDLAAATDSCLAVIADNAVHIDGIKVSLLNAAHEVAMRARLPADVRMYTGDDLNFPSLIQSGSDALLGIFDAIAPAASTALQRLDADDLEGFQHVLEPCLPLSRHIFQAPTFYYKTGVVFLAYLNGHQPHFRMLEGQESLRSVVHLAQVFVLADRAGLLEDPERACDRMRGFLFLAGLET